MTAAWFDGWLGPSETTHTYDFDPQASRLASPNSHGVFAATVSSGGVQGPGVWILAMRLRQENEPGAWRDAAVIPVLEFRNPDDGEIEFEIFDDVREG